MAWYRCVGGAGGSLKLRTASGKIATFSTNMVEAFKSLKSEINPVQDLHGYTKPWSGGGGKNKLKPCITSGTVNGVTYTVNDDGTIKLSNTATSEAIKTGSFDLKAGSYIYTSGVTESFDTYDTYLSVGGTTIARGISGYNSFTLAQDSTVTFGVRVRNGITPNVTIKPMVRLASVSDATFEPYSNICPISGFSALNVTRTGKNILPKLYEQTTKDGVTLTANTDGTLSFSGVASAICYFIKSFNLKKGSYIFSTGVDESFTTFDTYISKDGTIIARGGNNMSPNSFTMTEDSSVSITVRVRQGVNTDGLKIYPMIRLSSDSDTTYEPYNGQTITVNFGQTVYGGVADVTNGKVNVTYSQSIKLSDIVGWSYDSTYQYFYTTISDKKIGNTNLLCECYSVVDKPSATQLLNGEMKGHSASRNIYIKDTNYTDVTNWLNAVGNNRLIYELATPIEITTTPENLSALSGQTNNVFSDTNGDTEVKYLYRE